MGPSARATPPPKESKQKHGYLRLWNMLPKEAGVLLLIKENGTPEGDVLLSAAPNNYYASYTALPAGRYALKLVRSEAPDTVIENVSVTFRGDESRTILAGSVDRKLKVETLDETYDLATTLAGRLTIRQNFPNSRVTIEVGSQTRTRELASSEVEVVDGLPLQVVSLKMHATFADGKTSDWSTEVDFKTIRHATLLIVSDPYGRCRPHVALDGRAVVITPDPAQP